MELVKNKKTVYIASAVFVVLLLLYTTKNTMAFVGLQQGYVSIVTVISILLGCAMVALVCYLAFRRQWELYQLYPVIAGVLGALFIILMPVYGAPDEMAHFDTAYELSNKMMFVEETGDSATMYKRVCDTEYFETRLANDMYEKYGQTWQLHPDTSLVEAENLSTGKWIASIVPAIGITIGRILGLNFALVSILGMVFALAFFVAFMTYALKIIPVGQNALFMIALLPITLQQSRSYSYDAPLLLAAVLVIALSLHWRQESGVKKYEVVLYVIASFMLCYLKTGVYTVLILLPIFLFVKKEWVVKHKEILIAAVIVVIVGIVVVLRSQMFYQIISAEPYIAYEDTYAHSILYYLQNPKELIMVYYHTWREARKEYISQMLGSYMGWLEVMGSTTMQRILKILLLLSLVRVGGEELQLRGFQRAILILMGCASVFLATFAMLAYWTPADAATTAGVQGRYFLPILLPIALGVGQWKAPVVRRDYQKYLAIIVSAVNFLVVMNVLRYVIAACYMK